MIALPARGTWVPMPAFFQLDGKSAWTPDGGETWHPRDDRSRGFASVAVDGADLPEPRVGPEGERLLRLKYVR